MMPPRSGSPAAATIRTAAQADSAAPVEAQFARQLEVAEGTINELFFRAIDELDKPDAQLRRVGRRWEPISHRRILEDTHALSDALVDLGIQRGDRVAILSENRPEWPLADYALLCTGAWTVPVYPTLPANQAAYILAHAGARLVFVSTTEQLQKVLATRADLPDLEHVVLFDDGQADGVTTLRELIERGRALGGSENVFRMRATQARPADVATVIYTSGTTGQPKGVMLTHNNLYTNIVAGVGAISVGPADVSLSFLPLSHGFQRMVDFGLFAYGCTIAYVASFDQVSSALREVQPTLAVAVPRVYEKIYANMLSATGLRRRIVLWARTVALEWARRRLEGGTPRLSTRLQHALADRLVYRNLRERLGGRIRFFISGGAPLNSQIAEFFYGAGVVILEGYGLTETSPVVTVNTVGDLRIGTVGRPIAGTELRIAADGEVLVRGPQVMAGYYRNEQATHEVFDGEGWFHTGDIGALDAGGYLRITDRKKELIKTAGGKFIAPQPVETAAKRSPLVTEAMLVGESRPYAILLVVPNFDNLEARARNAGVIARSRAELVADARVRELLEHDIFRRLAGFARYEMPKKVLPIERELSLEDGEITPTLKLKRRTVEQRFLDRIESLYAEEPSS